MFTNNQIKVNFLENYDIKTRLFYNLTNNLLEATNKLNKKNCYILNFNNNHNNDNNDDKNYISNNFNLNSEQYMLLLLN